MGIVYISRKRLTELLVNPLFIAYAPSGGKISGGELNGKFYQVKNV